MIKQLPLPLENEHNVNWFFFHVGFSSYCISLIYVKIQRHSGFIYAWEICIFCLELAETKQNIENGFLVFQNLVRQVRDIISSSIPFIRTDRSWQAAIFYSSVNTLCQDSCRSQMSICILLSFIPSCCDKMFWQK